MAKELISQEDVMQLLNNTYKTVIRDLPGIKSCKRIADEYLKKYKNPELAALKMANSQILKCTTSGFVTGLGGVLTLPVAIPANLASVIYIQMRMIATMAAISGLNVNDDEVQTLVYVCLVGSSISEIVRDTGIKVGNKITMNLLKKMPTTVLGKINQKVGFHLLTRFSKTGLIKLSKLVPVAGGVIGGSVDLVTTKTIADKAFQTFFVDLKQE